MVYSNDLPIFDKGIFMKLARFLLCFYWMGLSGWAGAATDAQMRSWARFDTPEKIQAFTLSDGYDQYCGDQTNTDTECLSWTQDALSVECISSAMFTMLRSTTFKFKNTGEFRYYGFPECNRRNELLAICKCGCFIEGTRLLSILKGSKNWLEIEKLLKEQDALVTLEGGANDFQLGEAKKPNYMQSRNEQRKHNTVRLHYLIEGTAQVLQVTTSHPVLLSDGTLVMASQVQAGDLLLDTQGQTVEVTEVEHNVPYVGKVYNVDTQESSHIIFAEGVAVGDYRIQNDFDRQQGRLQSRQ